MSCQEIKIKKRKLNMRTKYARIFMFLICVFGFWSLSFNSASAGWTSGKYNSAIDFNGTSTYVDGFGAVGNINTVSFWIKADDLSKSIIDLNGTQTITVSVGVISANNFTSPTIYVDGKISSTLPDTADWHFVAITTATNISASTVVIGKVSTNYFDGKLDEVRLYNYVRAPDEIRLDYNAGLATHLGPSGKTCSEDPAGCMDYGLAGYWNMDEGGGQTAKDLSNSGNGGILGSSTSADASDPKWAKGKIGGALSFDGKDDYADAGDSSNLNIANAFSIESWMKPVAINSNLSSPEYGLSYIVSFEGNDLKYDDDVILSFRVENTSLAQVTSESSPKSLNKFYHVVGTYDNSTAKIYVDGVLEDSENQTGNVKVGSATHIGKFWYQDARRFNGLIDEVRIYNRALSAEEVRYHYNRGGPVAEWKFDEGSGQKAYDSVGNADGQLGSDGLPAGDANDPGWSAP